jgi:molybdate transport system ATP-binding protein
VPLVDAPVGTPIRIRVRARDVMLAVHPPDGLSAQNVLPATVESVPAVDTPIVDVALDVGGHRLVARITRRSVATLDLRPGKPVFAVIKSIAFDGHTLARGREADDDDGAVVDT